jgi:hypothetical protein
MPEYLNARHLGHAYRGHAYRATSGPTEARQTWTANQRVKSPELASRLRRGRHAGGVAVLPLGLHVVVDLVPVLGHFAEGGEGVTSKR